MATIEIKNGFITMPDVIDAECPSCKTIMTYNSFADKLSIDPVYKVCKSCRQKIGISVDYKGNTVTWLKKEEETTAQKAGSSQRKRSN